MIVVVDYGAGNLGSVYKALKHVAPNVEVSADPAVIGRAQRLVLPGVGAFTHCMTGLEGIGATQAVREFVDSGRPFLGICVGMQMLFESSEEMGASAGLGVLAGRVVRFKSIPPPNLPPASMGEEDGYLPPNLPPASMGEVKSAALKVPHIGWNALEFRPGAALFQGLEQGDRVYFVHSYYPEPADEAVISATTDHGVRFCCALESGNLHATQFHPEKSGTIGLRILRNFVSLPA